MGDREYLYRLRPDFPSPYCQLSVVGNGFVFFVLCFVYFYIRLSLVASSIQLAKQPGSSTAEIKTFLTHTQRPSCLYSAILTILFLPRASAIYIIRKENKEVLTPSQLEYNSELRTLQVVRCRFDTKSAREIRG